MVRLLKKFEKSMVFLLKLFLYGWLIGSFFLIMGIENWPLLRLSRTAGVTALTFVAVGLCMTMAYGTYAIGQRKSKPIISSLALATAITDIITELQLSIMNTNEANGLAFDLASVGLLVITFIVQLIGITIFVYGGNWLFFTVNKPQKCCLITDCKESFLEAIEAIGSFKKQYKVEYVRNYEADDLYDILIQCDTVFIYNLPIERRTEIVEYCYRNLINIYFNPEISDIVEINAKHTIIDDISFVCAPVKELSFEQRAVKRFMDIVLSVVILVVLSPVFLGCAIAIKVCDGGKVIFKQQRATKNGRIFSVYKFRTMKENAENYSAKEDDDRITSVGRVLRKYRLDELPQVLNILKGEMSFVGPRPEMLKNVYLYTRECPEFEYRLRVKAGLTGYAQIAGKYNTSPKYKLILDLMYIENYSLTKDIKLLLQTLVVFFKSDSTEGFNERLDSDIEKYRKKMDINL